MITIEDPAELKGISVLATEESAGAVQVVDLTTLEAVSVNPLRGTISGGTQIVLKLSSVYVLPNWNRSSPRDCKSF
ncbi:hypothetical protein P3T76_015116 [Phytophthora citrophthora]|uniref:Uncharacterized protein n=1 Tax=Phytophthora citrophthora TaxID=4793 RepID=A0AAD9LBN7_9STRA|nr:hypothetical protein P3T76_015116 [Phytophthora citrophthora]